VTVTREGAESLARRTQEAVCAAVESLEQRSACFRRQVWTRGGGGGGESRTLRGGRVFDSAGVNVSVVHGELPDELAGLAGGSRPVSAARFWATGVSIVLHPRNPMVPTMHANYRYFELESSLPETSTMWWFGGGSDLTPAYLFEDDVRYFHGVLRSACNAHDQDYYPRFKQQCDAYFLLPHRGECRGVGGIFFDRLADRTPGELLAFVTSCAESIVPAYFPIVQTRHEQPFTRRHRSWQRLRRGRYVEFNLLYDRGTQFGLRTGGRTESILMSLPPVAHWDDRSPRPGSPEATLLDVLRRPREWV
jgi:coproporphyrinogen III oxidase